MATKKSGKAYLAGKTLAFAIKNITDLFYQVDTRERFMDGLCDGIIKIRIEMKKDRDKRRKK